MGEPSAQQHETNAAFDRIKQFKEEKYTLSRGSKMFSKPLEAFTALTWTTTAKFESGSNWLFGDQWLEDNLNFQKFNPVISMAHTTIFDD